MKKLKRKTKLAKKQALWCLALALAVVIASGTNVALAEWHEPNSPPMAEQFPAPLTTGGENQAKEGYLLIDPVDYNPLEDTSLWFKSIRPLHVTGDGALFSIPYLYSDELTVDTDTLYVDSTNEWVGIGTTDFTSGIKLKVIGDTVKVGTEDTPIAGRAVSGYSGNNVGVYGEAVAADGPAGIYGLRMADSGWAVKGVVDGTSNNQVGVRGESPDGYGIYATSSAADQAAVYARNDSSGWAGYFDGRLGASSDVVANRFLPTNLQTSLIPFTSGQEVGSYSIGTWTNFPNTVRLAFDGTYAWAVTNDRDNDNHNLFKVRVSDGVVVDAFTVGTSNHHAAAFDGTYIWIVPASSEEVFRFDPRDGSYVQLDSSSGFSTTFPKQSLAVSSINGTAYVWTSDPLEGVGGEIIKINSSTLSFETFDFNGITGLTDPAELAFDGTYLWVTAQDSVLPEGRIVRLLAADPTSDPLVVDTFVLGCDPDDVYADGEYVWCLHNTDGKLLRIWAEDPYDAQHPMESFGPLPVGADDQDMVFDGTYLWVVDFTNSELYRYLAADPSQYNKFSLSFQPERIVFDSTYLWIPEVDGTSAPKLHKYYSGTGMGHTDLNTVVNLRTNTGFCSITTSKECIFDWQCPGGESCGAGHTSQAGNINIAGSAEINSQCLAKVGWTHNGVRVNDPDPRSPEGDWLRYPQAVEDGTGEGVIVVWQQRDTDDNIYAQRIRVNNGTSLWGDDKVIVDAASYQNYPMIVRASDGNFIIAWYDKRGGNYNIYAQKIDINGNPQWAANGIQVSDLAAVSHQLYSQHPHWIANHVAADGSGGAYIAWIDQRNNIETYDDDIYMQRIDTNGNRWANDVVIASEANRQSEFQLAYLSSTGDAMVTWTDCRDTDNPQDCPWGFSDADVYYQRINSSGSPVYAATPPGSYGVLLSDGTHATKNDADTPLMVVSDDIGGSQGVIIAHTRGGSNQKNIHGIKSSDGTVQWDVSVNNCSEYGTEHFQHAIPDGNDGMIFVWGGLIRRIDKDGNLSWSNSCHGLKFTEYTTSFQTQRLVSDGDGGAIITWVDRRPTWTEGTDYLYVQKVLKDGSIVWDDNGFRILDLAGSGTGGVYPEYYHVVSDGVRGGIVVWVDERNGIIADGRNNDVYAQRVMDCLQAGDVWVGADLDVLGNLWGGSDEIVSVSGDTAVCATDGYFIKGITLDSDSKISEIVCRGL